VSEYEHRVYTESFPCCNRFATDEAPTVNPENVSAEKCWYLVYTKPRQEDVARANLERQGYHVYLPRCHKKRRRSVGIAETIEPLFPRYLFIHLDTETDNWGPIRSTLGVASLVRFGRQPASVPAALISFLRSREGTDGLHAWATPEFRAGDRVRVASGPMEGYEGILVAKSSRERVLVLLDILGKRVRTQLDVANVEKS